MARTESGGSWPADLARRLDHTLLQPMPTADVVREYRAARDAGCASFVTHARYLGTLAGEQRGEGATPLSAVIDFPFGLSSTTDKTRQIDAARSLGAREVELVINQADAAEGNRPALESELRSLADVSAGLVRKVILETAYRTDREISELAALVASLGFEFVKTSTGYAPRGAEVGQVAMIRKAVGSLCGVKASGGIRDLRSCLAMIRAGADRIGTSCALHILGEAAAQTPLSSSGGMISA